MAHNYEATGSGGGSGDGYVRPTNLNTDEAQILTDNNILVPPAWHLPHRWHMSAVGYTVTPIPPEGPLLDDHIKQQWEALPPARGRRRAAFGSPSSNASGSSSSAGTSTPTTAGKT
jgi:hypothetical protein